MTDRTVGRLSADERLQLLALVAQGDEASFAQLYDDLAPAVYGTIKRVLRDPSQSEEVLQEVMVEVWRTATRFDSDKGSVAAWVSTMAHRRAVDRVRSEQSARDRTERESNKDVMVSVDPADEVVDDMNRQFERERVNSALASLTPLQRQSVELAFWGGHTHAEVSSLLDVPLGTVKTRIRDGLIRLRDSLGVES